MRRKILFLIPNLGGGGAERVVTTLLRHLDREVFEPMLGVADLSRNEFASLVPSDVPVHDLRGQRVRYALPYAVALIWKQRPHIVISTLDHMNLALAMSRPFWPRGVKYVLRLTNTISTEARINRIAMPIFLRLADALVYQSQPMREHFERELALPVVPSVVLHNPVDLDVIRRRAAEPPLLSFATRDTFNFIGVGRLDKEKGFDIAVEAMALLADLSITLTILGEGQERDRLANLIRDRCLEDRVRLAGFQSNPYPIIRTADALLLSSRYEGFPNVVLEALALQVPVAAAPVAGVPELLAGVPGCAVAGEISPLALATAMRHVAQASGKPPLSVLAPYSADVATRAYEQLFKCVTESGPQALQVAEI